MLKQTVQFTDFDDVNKTKNLYFNLTRVEVFDHIELKDEFENVQDMIGGATRDLEMHEVKLILDLVKKLMKLSYGVQKTFDGELQFVKSEEQWNSFTQTAVYDEFLIGLFENPEKAVSFLIGIWPKEITRGIDQDQLKLPGMPVKMDGQALHSVPVSPDDAPLSEGDPRPAWLRELRSPTSEEMRSMGTSDMQLAFRMKASGELDGDKSNPDDSE